MAFTCKSWVIWHIWLFRAVAQMERSFGPAPCGITQFKKKKQSTCQIYLSTMLSSHIMPTQVNQYWVPLKPNQRSIQWQTLKWQLMLLCRKRSSEVEYCFWFLLANLGQWHVCRLQGWRRTLTSQQWHHTHTQRKVGASEAWHFFACSTEPN